MYKLLLSIVFGFLVSACGTAPAPPVSGSGAAAPPPLPSPSPSPKLLTPTPLVYRGQFSGKVDVGGYHLFLRCVGEGAPTVVFDAGSGDTGDRSWIRIWPKVKGWTRVCVYDRANLGESDHAPRPRTFQGSITDLHALLTNAGISAPYVLVGHSFGGLITQLYVRQHPDEVVGLVLVDSSHADQFARIDPLVPTAHAGECRELKYWRPGTDPEGWDVDTIVKQMHVAPSFPANLPLVVLTAGKFGPPGSTCLPPTFLAQAREQWQDLQGELARLSSNSVHITADNSHHGIQHDQPQLVIDAIAQVIEASRTQKRLRTP